MNIALIGYGKMGKVIENIAIARGHKISQIIDLHNGSPINELSSDLSDVAIEFTQPSAAYGNLKSSITSKVPVVCGTTGWLDKYDEIVALTKENNTAFFYSSNYSVGVNLYFHFNKVLAKVMNNYPQYEVSMEEIHHTQKLDAPSGTAITAAEGIIDNIESKSQWVNDPSEKDDDLFIKSLREENVPGTHTTIYKHAIDTIELKHTAHSREGFATGAVLAAEFIANKQGIFGMKDLLELS